MLQSKEMQFRPPPPGRRDMNHERNKAYFDAIHDAKAEGFDRRFGERQMYLAAICIDPAYQRCGIGSGLLQWGMDKARAEKAGISLFSSPGGRALYAKMGFKEAIWTKAQVPGDDAFIEFPGMYWVADESEFPTTRDA